MFSKIKNFFCQIYSNMIILLLPIKKDEVTKYTYISIMLFSFLFVQNIVRNLKDTLSVRMIGVEANSNYKVLIIPLFVVIFMYLYTNAVSRYTDIQIFYFVITCFLIWFCLFGFILFPYREYLTFSATSVDFYAEKYYSMRWLIRSLSNWPLGLFYVLSEFWQSLIITIVAWQFIMNILTLEQSHRMFISFSIISQSGLVCSGLFMYYIKVMFDFLGLTYKIKNLVYFSILTIVLFAFLGIYMFYILSHKYSDKVLKDDVIIKSNRQHPGLWKSILIVIKSKYTILIALIIFSYGLTINLVESKWKIVVNENSLDDLDYFRFQGELLISQGVIAVIFGLLGANLIRYGWTKIAIIPALLTLFLGGMFFIVLIFFPGYKILYDIGFWYITYIKAGKYIFLDNTKELIYKALPLELRTKGKGSVDLLANKYGKAGASGILMVLYSLGFDLKHDDINVMIAMAFLIFTILWILSVMILGRLYNKKLKHSIAK